MDDLDKMIAEELTDQESIDRWEALLLRNELIETLIKLRNEKKLTQKQIAKLLDTKQSAISRIETGNQNITLDFIQKIANVLDTKVKIIFEPKKSKRKMDETEGNTHKKNRNETLKLSANQFSKATANKQRKK